MGRNWIKEKMMLLLIFVALASANICSSGQRGYSDTKCKIMKNGEESYCARFQDRPVWYKNLNLVHRKSLDIRVDLEMVAKVVNGRHAAGVRNSCCLKRTQSMPAGEYKVLCRQTTRQIFSDPSVVDQERERLGDEASPEEEEDAPIAPPPRVSSGISQGWLRRKMDGASEVSLGRFQLKYRIRTGNDILGWNAWETTTKKPSNVTPYVGGSYSLFNDPIVLRLMINNNKLRAGIWTVHPRTPARGNQGGQTRAVTCKQSISDMPELQLNSSEKITIPYMYLVRRGSFWRPDGSDDADCQRVRFGRGNSVRNIPLSGRIRESGATFKSEVLSYKTSDGNNGELQLILEGTF